MSRLDLPDGEWAELAAPRKVSDRRRQAYLVAVADAAALTADLPKVAGPDGTLTVDPAYLRGEHVAAQAHAFDLLVLCYVKAWSLPDPVTLDAVQDLDTGTKDTIVGACLPLMTEMMPDYSPDVDPKAPTSASTPPPPGSSTADRELSAILSSGNTS